MRTQGLAAVAVAGTAVVLLSTAVARAAVSTPVITDIQPFLQQRYPFVEATPTPMWSANKAVEKPDRPIGLGKQAFAEASSSPYAGTGTPPPATEHKAAKGKDEDNGKLK